MSDNILGNKLFIFYANECKVFLSKRNTKKSFHYFIIVEHSIPGVIHGRISWLAPEINALVTQRISHNHPHIYFWVSCAEISISNNSTPPRTPACRHHHFHQTDMLGQNKVNFQVEVRNLRDVWIIIINNVIDGLVCLLKRSFPQNTLRQTHNHN